MSEPGGATGEAPLVSVLILSRGRTAWLRRCLDSVCAQDHTRTEIIVLANGCADTASFVRDAYPDVHLIELPDNIGSAPGRNRVTEPAEGRYWLFLDDDGEIRATDTLTRLIEGLESDPRAGMVSMAIYDAELDEPTGWARSLGPVPYSCYHDGFAGGACLMRAAAFRECGGYIEAFTGPSEEFGLAVRLYGAGWAIRHVPDLVFHHHVDKTDEHWRELISTGYSHLQYVTWRLYPAPWSVLASLRLLATQLYIDLRQQWGRHVLPEIAAAVRWAWRGLRDRSPVARDGLSALYAAKYYRIDDGETLDRARRGVLFRLPILRLLRKRRRVAKLPWPQEAATTPSP